VFGHPGKVLLEKVRVILDSCVASYFRIEVAIGTLSTAERDMQIETGHEVLTPRGNISRRLT